MELQDIDPRSLSPNPWNPNEVSPEAMERLTESLRRHGFVKPVLTRQTDTGPEILGGQHRVEAAISLGLETVPMLDLGRMSDARAKEIGLIDNARYGNDDTDQLAAIIEDIGGSDMVAEFLPFSDAELAALATDVNVDDIDDLIDGKTPDSDPDETPKPKPKTHTIMRFKVSIEDEDTIRNLIEEIKMEQGFVEEDDLTNAGDALVYLANQLKEIEHEQE